jgi:hypothetical protein
METTLIPRERTAAWRLDNPLTQEVHRQEAIVKGWIAEPDTCPYTLHRLSYQIRSKRTGRQQAQLIVKDVRMNRSVVTWFLLHNEWVPPSMLDFAPRLHSIQRRSDLE